MNLLWATYETSARGVWVTNL